LLILVTAIGGRHKS